MESRLPTQDEYKELFATISRSNEWSNPLYICPKCGGNVRRNETIVLTSNPPKHQYKCEKCGFCEYF